MRWKGRKYLKEDVGKTRIRRKFLILPRSFNKKHWRWWEYADVVEEVVEMDVGGHDEWGRYSYEWREVGFADEMEEKI